MVWKWASLASDALGRSTVISAFPGHSVIFRGNNLLAWNAGEIPPASTCHLKVFAITGLGLQQLNWRASQSILPQYMSGFLKTLQMSSQPP